jgi:hypothetical protein
MIEVRLLSPTIMEYDSSHLMTYKSSSPQYLVLNQHRGYIRSVIGQR